MIRTKSHKVLPNFGFARKGQIDHVGVLQTPIMNGNNERQNINRTH